MIDGDRYRMSVMLASPGGGCRIGDPPAAADRFAHRTVVDGKFLARGPRRTRLQGVTYGPFAPSPGGWPFPPPERVRADFAAMQALGVNALRTYHPPPAWLPDLAGEAGLDLLIGVPWASHLCFLRSRAARCDARLAVRRAAEAGRRYPSVLAYCVGNEIPPGVVRWHGARRVERFLRELRDVAKSADQAGLVTYASYPPTEYLDLSPFDFVTFNVYLHDVGAFRRYLFRLQNLAAEKPLVLGELGLDTLRYGEAAQAWFLREQLREATLMGTAGTFVFSWTDDWHTGGSSVTDWRFGVTDAGRRPRPAARALREVWARTPAELLPAAPRVSVVVCSYNSAATLGQCLDSLAALRYPDYEVIVVDDGSTDDTRAVLARHAEVRAIHQPNLGLSAARNTGWRAATGAVVAYTDADCFADPDWLTLLVAQLRPGGAAAVGGPNLSPDDGRLAACVAAAPGQPTHVLESEQVAEHIPGCNMAFRREVLEAICGFDPLYRTAGDDVDVCWRLQRAGYWITFAPGAVVWHHRRQTPWAYLRQQAGYGAAEAQLRFKHPDRFNGFGGGVWRGVLYGRSVPALRLTASLIYRGTFGTALFQNLYTPAPAYWPMLPGTLEWHAAAGVVALLGLHRPGAWVAAGVMGCLSLAVAGLQAYQARVPAGHDGLLSRLLIAALSYAQPLVRSWARYRTRWFAHPPRLPVPDPVAAATRVPPTGQRTLAYWGEPGPERADFVGRIVSDLTVHRWSLTLDSGWSDWDVEIWCGPWAVLRLCTVQENHGGPRRLTRARYRLRPTRSAAVLVAAAGGCGLAAAALSAWAAGAAAAGMSAAFLTAWLRAARRASEAVTAIDALARDMALTPVEAPA
jgi:hypothetical protein